jgi:hypothetical protein
MMTRQIAAIIALTLIAGPALAQSSYLTAGTSWSSSYGFPSPTERAVRLQYMESQRRLSAGFYDNLPSTTVNTYNDHSVGDTTISAAEGAYVALENRTGQNSGTSSYAVGAINTSNNNISIEGDGNHLDIVSAAESTGCQDGSITMALNEMVGGVDISAGASGASASSSGSSAITSGSSSCN